jgi:hypothetical protein
MFNEGGLVGSHLRGDRFYGEVVSSVRAILTVRSEIGPYRSIAHRSQLSEERIILFCLDLSSFFF